MTLFRLILFTWLTYKTSHDQSRNWVTFSKEGFTHSRESFICLSQKLSEGKSVNFYLSHHLQLLLRELLIFSDFRLRSIIIKMDRSA